jgi:hypothetical protein
LKKLQNCYDVYTVQGVSDAWDNNLEKIRCDINGEVESLYKSGILEGTEDDLAEIPKVLESLNEQWQESTKQGVLFTQRLKKRIEGNAKVKGQGQRSGAEALSQPSRPLQQPSPAKAPPQGAAEGIGTGDDQVAAAVGIAGSPSGAGGGGDDGAGDGPLSNKSRSSIVAQGAPASQMQQPPPLGQVNGQVNSPAIHAGGKGKGKEKVAEGDVEEEEEEVADSEEEGVQKSRSMRKQVAGPCPPCAKQNNSIAVCFAQGHLYLTQEGEVPSSCKDCKARNKGAHFCFMKDHMVNLRVAASAVSEQFCEAFEKDCDRNRAGSAYSPGPRERQGSIGTTSGSVSQYSGHFDIYIYIYIYILHTHTYTNTYTHQEIWTLKVRAATTAREEEEEGSMVAEKGSRLRG